MSALLWLTTRASTEHGFRVVSSIGSDAGGFAIGLAFGVGIQVMMKWLRRQGATSDQQVILLLPFTTFPLPIVQGSLPFSPTSC